MTVQLSGLEQEKAYRAAWYEMPGVGGGTLAQLAAVFGSAQRAWEAPLEKWGKVTGKAKAKDISARQREYDVEGKYFELKARGLTVLVRGLDDGYPELLGNQAQSPALMYVWGELKPADARAVAVVGSRRPTAYGREVTQTLAYDLSGSGYCIVSGLAYGVDSMAHRAALKAGGRTVAVLGSPITQVTPRAHQTLAEEISRHGAVVSTFALGKAVKAGQFVARDATIAGMALGVIVTEGGAESGSLYTAEFSKRLGRPVMAVPGPVTSRMSEAPTQLIKKGGVLVTNAGDVMAVLGATRRAMRAAGRLSDQKIAGLNPVQKKIVVLINRCTGLTVDQLSRKLGQTPAEVGIQLTMMEVAGVVGRRGDQWMLGEGR